MKSQPGEIFTAASFQFTIFSEETTFDVADLLKYNDVDKTFMKAIYFGDADWSTNSIVNWIWF